MSTDWLQSFESGVIICIFPEKKLKLQFIIKNFVYGHRASKVKELNWKLVELKRLIITFVYTKKYYNEC